jgi:hypothetical protein
MKLFRAQQIAETLRETLRPACDRIEIAGSIRREKDDVKDVELVAIVRDYDDLFNRILNVGFTIKPGTHEILPWAPKRDSKYIRIMSNEGIKVDLFIGTPDNWGPLFVMRTGSATGTDGNPFSGFVPALFQRWKKISGGGRMVGCMPTYPDGTCVPCPEEDDFFELLQMTTPPPQRRSEKKIIKEFAKA